ncbi:cation diffusion facilitator family transporter [Aquabacter sp. L1I39]|uniref:cation diffusion facilitator family transporter n=1 Tax=Aquabacter sp. L1I39 TaxID=2820278 RepID=UPI001FFCEDCB|nr:cation diffusion facilitator family transporter [Aquabacter sp. L1I39]
MAQMSNDPAHEAGDGVAAGRATLGNGGHDRDADGPTPDAPGHDDPGHDHAGQDASSHHHPRHNARQDHSGHAHGAHDHDPSHAGHSHSGHSHAAPSSLRAFAIGASVNLAFVVVEAVFGVLSGSLSLLADAGHNLSDVLGLVLAWAAAWLSRRPPTDRRTFGFGRSSILAALANALILIAGTGGIIWEAVTRFADPAPIQTGVVMVVALIGIIVNFGTALLFMADRKKDLNVRGAFVHLVADAAISLGVVVAAGVIGLTGWLWLDPLVSIGISVAIIAGTWGLFRDSFDLALDAVPANVDGPAVAAYLKSRPGVAEVHDLHIWALSTTEVALTAHLVRPGAALDDAFLMETCAELKARFDIGHAALQVEAGEMACPLASPQVV